MWQLGNSSCPFSAEHTQHDKKCQLTNKVGQGLSILQRDLLELMADFSWPFLNVIKYLPGGVINLESMCGTTFCRASNIYHDIISCPLVVSWFGNLLVSFPNFFKCIIWLLWQSTDSSLTKFFLPLSPQSAPYLILLYVTLGFSG